MSGWIPDEDKTPMFGIDRNLEVARLSNRPLVPVPWRLRFWGVWWLLCEIWPTLWGRR